MSEIETQKKTDIGLLEIFYLFWHRKILILSCVAACFVGAALLMTQLEPLYAARAMIKIEKDGAGSHNMQTVLAEIEVLNSRPLATQIVSTLNLHNNPTFGVEEQPQAIEALDSGLKARPLGKSHVIEVIYKGTDPALARDIANEAVVQYIKGQIGAKFNDNQQNTQWLDKRLKDMAVRVRQSAQAVEQYRRKHALVGGETVDITSQQISEINTQLVLAKTRTAEAEARLAQVQEIVDGKSALNSLPAALSSVFIQGLKQEETRLLRHLAELNTRYGAKHPDIINAKGELSGQRRKIKQEIQKIADALVSDYDIAEARQRSLEETLDELEAERSVENQSSIQLEELTREAEANKELYETLLGEFKKADQEHDIQRPDARVISRADMPVDPVWPNKLLIFFLAGLGGVMIGVTGALVIETMDNGYRTSRDLEDVFKIPAITMIPLVDGDKKVSLNELAGYILNEPYSAIAEAIRSLRVSLSLRNNPDVKVISVTSSVPGEGKTTLSVWLSRALAKSGKKVLLIDCDLRRPSVHTFFGADNAVTLVDVLLGKKTAEELISIDQETGLHRIYARPMEKGEADILSSGGMEQLVSHLRDLYDLIVLDTPPSLAVSDSRLLSKMADKVLYVVQWKKTPREVVNTAVRHLMRDDIDIAGFVISQVNTKKHTKNLMQPTYGE